MRLVLSLAVLLGKAVADQCFVCTERFDSNGVLQTDNRFCDKKVKVNLSRYKLYRFLTLRHSEQIKTICIGRIQTLFLWILKSFDFEILTISSDLSSKMSQVPKK